MESLDKLVKINVTQRTFWAECRVAARKTTSKRHLTQSANLSHHSVSVTLSLSWESATELRLYAEAISVCLGTQLFRAFRQDREQGHLNRVLYQNERISCCLLYKFYYCMYLNLCRQGYWCLFSVQKKRVYERCLPRRRCEYVFYYGKSVYSESGM